MNLGILGILLLYLHENMTYHAHKIYFITGEKVLL
jgi:hypothetical protein